MVNYQEAIEERVRKIRRSLLTACKTIFPALKKSGSRRRYTAVRSLGLDKDTELYYRPGDSGLTSNDFSWFFGLLISRDGLKCVDAYANPDTGGILFHEDAGCGFTAKTHVGIGYENESWTRSSFYNPRVAEGMYVDFEDDKSLLLEFTKPTIYPLLPRRIYLRTSENGLNFLTEVHKPSPLLNLELVIRRCLEGDARAMQQLKILGGFPDLVRKYFETARIERDEGYKEEQRKIASLKEL